MLYDSLVFRLCQAEVAQRTATYTKLVASLKVW